MELKRNMGGVGVESLTGIIYYNILADVKGNKIGLNGAGGITLKSRHLRISFLLLFSSTQCGVAPSLFTGKEAGLRPPAETIGRRNQ